MIIPFISKLKRWIKLYKKQMKAHPDQKALIVTESRSPLKVFEGDTRVLRGSSEYFLIFFESSPLRLLFKNVEVLKQLTFFKLFLHCWICFGTLVGAFFHGFLTSYVDLINFFRRRRGVIISANFHHIPNRNINHYLSSVVLHFSV